MYKLRFIDRIFFFNSEQKEAFDKIYNSEKVTSDFKTWAIISIALPFLTYVMVAILNSILCNGVNGFVEKWPTILLNGSLPIIAFGIISSGVPYLMEELVNPNPGLQRIRRRVMAVALLFLFLSAVIYVFQTLLIINVNLSQQIYAWILLFSVIISVFSIAVGFRMFLLQSVFLDDFSKLLNSQVDPMVNIIQNANQHLVDDKDDDSAPIIFTPPQHG